MDGLSLYRKVRETRKHVPFLLVTGELLTREEILGNIQDPAFDVVPKPFLIEALLEKCLKLAALEPPIE
jgi:DNA-binding response OmpR family regulator